MISLFLEDIEKYDVIIVSRHLGAIEWLAQELGYEIHKDDSGTPIALISCNHFIPIFSEVTEQDVIGKTVIGNLPLWLASLAESVIAIEFSEKPPRGSDYGVEEMKQAGAKLTRYFVIKRC